MSPDRKSEASVAERQELVRQAIAVEDDDITPEEDAILDERLADFRCDPSGGISAEDCVS